MKSIKPKCEVCGGEFWVCENHPGQSWKDGDGCCGGAGMPCPVCNTQTPPKFPTGTKVIWTAKDGYAH